MLYVNTNFATDHCVSKITWMIESCEVRVNLKKFVLHLSIGSKVARDKVNQIAHVQKARGSLGTKNMAAEMMSFGYWKSVYFQRWSEYSSAFEVLNARGKLKLGKKMLDYIINQSCDEKRVVDVVHVGHQLTGMENWLNWRHLEHTETTPLLRHEIQVQL